MSDVVLVAVIAAVPAVLATVLGFLNRSKLGAVESKVDGRLTELLELTRKSSHSAGAKDQRDTSEPL